jgi:membrane protein DedA with SNARE-associated domain
VGELTELYPVLVFFCLLVAAGLGFPMPEELPVVGAGIWVGSNEELGLLRWIALPMCILGVVISDGLLYGIGRYFGQRLLEFKWAAKLMPAEKRQEIEKNFNKYGIKILLFARLLPGIRSPIFITAGIMRLPLRRFLLADGIYAIPGVSLLFFLAFWFGQQFTDIVVQGENIILKARGIIVMMIIIAIACYFVYHFLHRPVTTGDPKELPLVGGQMAAKMQLADSAPAVPVAVHPPSANGQPTAPKEWLEPKKPDVPAS